MTRIHDLCAILLHPTAPVVLLKVESQETRYNSPTCSLNIHDWHSGQQGARLQKGEQQQITTIHTKEKI